MGMAALLAQTGILAGTGLLLNSGFRLRPGSLTFVFALNGVLVTITKGNFYLLPVPIVAGVVADVWVAWTARRPGRPSASLCAVIGAAYAIAYMADISLHPAGSAWGPSLWAGAIMAATLLCWLLGRLLRSGLPAAVIAPYPMFMGKTEPERWTPEANRTAWEQLIRDADANLGAPVAVGRS